MSPGRSKPTDGSSLVGPYLRSVRRSLGLTLRQVSERTDPRVGESYLSQIETGRIAVPSPKALKALAQAYEIDAGDLWRRAFEVESEPDADTPARLPEYVRWLPASTLKNLDEDEREEVLAYLRLIEDRRARRK